MSVVCSPLSQSIHQVMRDCRNSFYYHIHKEQSVRGVVGSNRKVDPEHRCDRKQLLLLSFTDALLAGPKRGAYQNY